MTIQTLDAYYRGLGHVSPPLYHTVAPLGQGQLDFRTNTQPQRRVYISFRELDGTILSVTYWKLGDGETFSAAEQNYLTSLNRQHAPLIAKIVDGSGGSEFECLLLFVRKD